MTSLHNFIQLHQCRSPDSVLDTRSRPNCSVKMETPALPFAASANYAH